MTAWVLVDVTDVSISVTETTLVSDLTCKDVFEGPDLSTCRVVNFWLPTVGYWVIEEFVCCTLKFAYFLSKQNPMRLFDNRHDSCKSLALNLHHKYAPCVTSTALMCIKILQDLWTFPELKIFYTNKECYIIVAAALKLNGLQLFWYRKSYQRTQYHVQLQLTVGHVKNISSMQF